MSQRTALAKASMLACSLASLAFQCGSDDLQDDALLINQTDDEIEVKVRRLSVDCVEIGADQVHLLTRSDFVAPQARELGARALEVMHASERYDCTTDLLWLEVGDFAGLLRWSSLEQINLEDGEIRAEFFSRAVLVEGTLAKPVISIGSEIEVFDPPPEGAPTLPGAPP